MSYAKRRSNRRLASKSCVCPQLIGTTEISYLWRSVLLIVILEKVQSSDNTLCTARGITSHRDEVSSLTIAVGGASSQA